MNYVGIDYHKKYSHVMAIDEESRVIRSRRLENKPESFQEFFKRLDGPSKAALLQAIKEIRNKPCHWVQLKIADSGKNTSFIR
jgi:hypothetical protein